MPGPLQLVPAHIPAPLGGPPGLRLPQLSAGVQQPYPLLCPLQARMVAGQRASDAKAGLYGLRLCQTLGSSRTEGAAALERIQRESLDPEGWVW